MFGNICFFYNGDMVFAEVNILSLVSIPMLQINAFSLPNVPGITVETVHDFSDIYAVEKTDIHEMINVESILCPCVIVKDLDSDIDSSVMLILPCSSLPEYC